MATFGYEAVDKAGKIKKGSIEAENEEQVKRELKNQGLIVMDVTTQNALNKDINIDFSAKPQPRDLGVMCRQFVSMTRAGVAILDALRMLGEQTENKKLQEAIREVRVDVEKGETLAGAMSRHKVFPDLMIHMIAAGEASGSLDVALDRMSTSFERSAKTQALVKKAMIYPIILMLVAIAVVVLMLTFVIPSYANMFADLGTDLPGITLALMAASDFLRGYWYIIVPVVIAIVVGIKVFAASDTGKHVFGKAALTIPAVKNVVVKSASASMARTMSTLLASGVPLTEATNIVASTMTNVWFKEAMQDAASQIMVGVPLSQPLETCGLFPPMVYQMTRIGEEAGNTEDMLSKLADYYDEEVEMAVASLMAAMEPMIILVLAAVVGTMVAAIIAPMGAMYNALDNL
ncbi:MAG: type II secretion system F family protein [Lachnospiraceae bacterium]|nr:type II secretion system F family protein [Lachnospiraceae bacterium]